MALRLGQQLEPPAGAPTMPPDGRLALALAGAGARVDRPVLVEIAGGEPVPARMRLLGFDEEMEATAALSEVCRRAQLEATFLTSDVIEGERARQYLARAVRDPDDPSRPLGSIEHWHHRQITQRTVELLWVEYADLVASFDPAGGELALADAEAIGAAVQKKSLASLLTFGTYRLALWLLSSAGQPAGSPIPRSSDGSPATEPLTTG